MSYRGGNVRLGERDPFPMSHTQHVKPKRKHAQQRNHYLCTQHASSGPPSHFAQKTHPTQCIRNVYYFALYVHGHHRFTYPPPSRAVRHIHQAEGGRQDFVIGVDDLNVNGTGARLKVETEFGGEKSLQMMHGYGGWTL